MRRLLYLFLIFTPSTTLWADDISIPTDADHPFDLTLGEVISERQRQHFTQNGVENMYDGDQLVYTLHNREDVDFFNFYLEATKDAGTETIDLSLKSEDGQAVADTTFAIDQSGTYTYGLRTPAMKKGRYTLKLTFHQLSNKSWDSATLNGLAFRVPQSLKPGDEVEVLNPEFDDAMNGWTLTGGGQANALYTMFGNNCYVKHYNQGTGQLQQTVYNLPDGVYLFCLGAYDSYNDQSVAPDTYVYLNDRMVPMKTAYDEAVSYRNIWRWYAGQNNNNYRRTADGRFVPTRGVDWNEALAMAEQLYENCVVAAVTNGQAAIGWRKTGNRDTRIAYDHARLVYLSDDVNAQFDEAALRTQHQREHLNAQLSLLNAQLANGQPHAPQAEAEGKALIAAVSGASPSDLPAIIDAQLHAEHLQQRLALPFYEVTVPDGSSQSEASQGPSAPSGLADQLAAAGIQTTDTIALKLNGTPTAADLATLKTLKNLMELDLSDATLTELPKSQFQDLHLLTWVTLPRQLETIGESAFSSCLSLRDMLLPASLRTIDVQAFNGCISLDRAVIPEGMTVGNQVYRQSGIRSIVLPQSLGDVPYGLCTSCTDLIDIQFNGQVVINESAFNSCTALTTINVPEGIEWLMYECFGNCTALTSATLPSTLYSVYAPFSNCRNLKQLTCLAMAPPDARSARITGDYAPKDLTLRVLWLSVADYQEADKWKELNVEGADLRPQTFTVYSPLTIDTSDGLPADWKPDVNLGLYTYFWGGNVSSIATRGALTVDGSQMLSTGRLTQLYNLFACRSNRNRTATGYTDFFASLINQGQMRADQVTTELRFYPEKWEYLSFPFDARVGDIEVLVDGLKQPLSEVPFVIYGYDCAKRAEGNLDGAWVRMTADSTLHAGRGYIWQTTLGEEMTSLGTPHSQFLVNAVQNATKPLYFRSGDVETTLDRHYSEFAHNRSWNFIGNPYPAFFDIRYMDTTAPIIVQEYTYYGGRYAAYSPLDDYYALHPGQAFFIQRPLDSESVIFHQEGRQHSIAQRDYIAAGTRRTAQPHRQVFNLELITNEPYDFLDRTRFVINPTASLSYEQARDAAKFDSPGAAELYTHHDGIRYAINERPFGTGEVSLGLRVPTEGTYTLSAAVPAASPAGSAAVPAASPAGSAAVPAASPAGSITLIDLKTGTETNLCEGPYTFQAEAGTTDNRFLIRLGDGTPTAAPSVAVSQQPSQLYDLQGRRIASPQPGIYIKDHQKVIIK